MPSLRRHGEGWKASKRCETQSVNRVKNISYIFCDLVRVEMFEVERSTGAGGLQLLLVLSGLAVSLVLLALTVSDGRAQPEEASAI